MNNADMMRLMMKMAMNNPNIKNNPQAQEWIKVIQDNDVTKGEEIANNIIQTMGLSKEEAIKQAKSGLEGMIDQA